MWWILWSCMAGAAVSFLVYVRYHRLNGKLVVLTGGDSGIGLAIARELARQGYRLVLAGEDESRGSAAAGDIARQTGGSVQYRHLDLASLISIRHFAADLKASERHLDILINNAAVTQKDNSLTEDGIVVEMQINHFGPFLLTNLLLPMLKASPQGRIITASSVMHYLGNVNIDTIADKARDKHTHKRAFATSKLCNILFTRELSKRLRNSKVSANCFHPGTVEHQSNNQKPSQNYSSLLKLYLGYFFYKSHDEGTTAVYLATSSGMASLSGKYFVDCKETNPSKAALDDVLSEKLWIVSEKLVKLNEVV